MIETSSSQSEANRMDFLIIRIGSNEFAIQISSIDGICEFCVDPLESSCPNLILGKYCRGTNIIPIINLNMYLKCPNDDIILSPQMRIIVISSSEHNISIGFVVDAIIRFYPNIPFEKLIKSEIHHFSIIRCYKTNFEIKINSSFSYPILEINKIIDILKIKKLLKTILI